MKVGDKVYCKKTYSVLYKKQKEYTITKMLNNSMLIRSDTGDAFIFYDNICERITFMFSDYFYTEKEYRKIKLNKINESI